MLHAHNGLRPDGPSVSQLPRRMVAALDPSSAIGIAIGTFGARVPDWTHTIELPQIGGEGARFAAFSEWFADFLERYAPGQVILEAPLPPPAQTHFRSCAQQYGLRALAYDTAYRASCAISEIDVGTVRFETTGRRFYSKGTVKREIMAFVRARGVKATTSHAADAALIFMWHSQRVNGQPGLLWSEAA